MHTYCVLSTCARFRWRSTNRLNWDSTRARQRTFWEKSPDGSTWSRASNRKRPPVYQWRVSATTILNCKWCPVTRMTSWLATGSSTWREPWSPAERLSKVSTWWTSTPPKVRVQQRQLSIRPRPSAKESYNNTL